eukprot:TRINITY_DN12567_c0_g1_i1.p1 TRINITY_DN12567_c0_g1~~TRINITY_DN12567_c0_g1_i1.p1  ORF type:complete len:308 (-),score=46.74 TRINITY_DN12567_c0_g1_i1:223-1146(-)
MRGFCRGFMMLRPAGVLWLLFLCFTVAIRPGISVLISSDSEDRGDINVSDEIFVEEWTRLKSDISQLERLLEERDQEEMLLNGLIEEKENEIKLKLQTVASLQDKIMSFKEKQANEAFTQASEVFKIQDKSSQLVNDLKAAIRNQNQILLSLERQAEETKRDMDEKILKYEKLEYAVTEQWMYIQQLEQALHIAEVSMLRVETKGTEKMIDLPIMKIWQRLPKHLSVHAKAVEDWISKEFILWKKVITFYITEFRKLLRSDRKALIMFTPVIGILLAIFWNSQRRPTKGLHNRHRGKARKRPKFKQT